MKKQSTIIGIALISLSAFTANGASFGYADGTCDRNNSFRVGNASAQGTAIRLSNEKLQTLKGCKITSIDLTVYSTRTADGNLTLFIGTSPDTPFIEQTVTPSRALKWLEFQLESPYTITGDETELYIGFRGDISSSASLLMHDGNDVPKGCCYVLDNKEWVELENGAWGCPNVRFDVQDAPALTDIILKPVTTDRYFKADQGYKFNGQLFNFGSEIVRSFDLDIAIGDNPPVTKTYRDLEIAPSGNFNYILDEYTSALAGHLPLKIEVNNINGGSDNDPADNGFESELYFYPSDMERAFILEGFTGQQCGNCPAAHVTFENFLKSVEGDRVIEVMHHSGYSPDIFSMDADYDYTFFYGVSNTYAPAMMFNRYHFPVLGSFPVVGVNSTDIYYCYNTLLNTQPYVSLGLSSSFDPDTRSVTLKVKALTHNDLPSDNNVLNVILLQDGLQGYQSGAGSLYVHNAVFRGTLTGNSWGKLLPAASTKAGGEVVWEHSFVLPDAIFSDYWASSMTTEKERKPYTHAAVPENMRLVAYIGSLGGDDPNNHQIYNAVEVKLGESHDQRGFASGVDNIICGENNANDILIKEVNRKIIIDGEYESASIFNLRGGMVGMDSILEEGIYIVKVVSSGKVTVKKLMVR